MPTHGLPFALVVVALLAPASTAKAQRLLMLVPGSGQAASAGDLGPSIGPVPTAVRVDLELLRGAPARLEVPTPDGSVLSAERSVFEDRGGGDLMWSGGQPGAGYDTVVLTVEGGRLVGRFGAAGGGAYRIHAERDGRGGMAPVVGPRSDGAEPWCAVEADADLEDAHDAHAPVRAGVADLPERVRNPQNHDRLDILVLYTATAAENWAGRGGARAAIRHAGDYLKMVFRNNRIPVEPHIVHIARDFVGLDRVGRDSLRHELGGQSAGAVLLDLMRYNGELKQLRAEHQADLVHLFTGEGPGVLDSCGRQSLLRRELTQDFFRRARGWTSNACGNSASVIFAHEIGHGLGAHHDPINGRSPEPFASYSYGYVNFDVLPSLGTAMSYQGQIEPFFSTPRIRPWRARAGIAGEQDNERTVRETVHIGTRYSDSLDSVEGLPKPVGDLRGRIEDGEVHLSWRAVPDVDAYVVRYQDGSSRRQRVEGTSVTIRLEEDPEPGSGYFFYVTTLKDGVTSVDSYVLLVAPGEQIAAPSDVSATVDVFGGIRVNWIDNSENELAFDVQLLRNGEPIERMRQEADLTVAYFGRDEWQVGAEYGVRVFAWNPSGSSESSNVATFRWEHPEWVGPVAGLVAKAIGPTTVRLMWRPVRGVENYLVETRLENWLRRDHASERLRPGGPSFVDLDALPRGGRYEFVVRPDVDAGPRSRTHLTLGARATGPRGPSDLSSSSDGTGVRLTWKDNSDDELGFVIVKSDILEGETNHGGTLEHMFCVPPDVESAVVHADTGDTFRVFAYNHRGYSANSRPVHPGSAATSFGAVSGAAATTMSCVPPRPPPDPPVPPEPVGPCRADAETLCLHDTRFQVKVDWRNTDGESGVAQVAEDRTNDSGLFRFFDPENWEILIKVLDGCRTNGRMWVLGASTTNLGYRILVTDTVTGESRAYENEAGRPAPAIVDTDAFASPCDGGGGP